ncbi:hydrogenase assembly protein HypC [Nitrospira sp.]|nr:hydrogenase assembly protein HypC [Nitrospira sp.]
MCLAIPGEVVTVQDDPLRMATVRFGAITKDVSLAMVPDATIGDYVVVHVGFAISKLDEAAARASLALLRQLETDGSASEEGAVERLEP